MSSLDNPASGLAGGRGRQPLTFFSAAVKARGVEPFAGCHAGRATDVAGIAVEPVAAVGACGRWWSDDVIQRGRQQPHIVDVGRAGDDRERDSTPVYKQAALAAFFSPDLLG